MTDKELMQMALDAITDWGVSRRKVAETVEALRTALAQPDVPETAFWEMEPVAIKFQIYKQTPQRGRELEPINSALLPWVYDQDPSSGNTASMWVTPVATLPPKREWVGLTDAEAMEIEDKSPDIRRAIIQAEAKLKEKNT